VTIEALESGGGSFVIDRATQYEITTDLMSPSCARFELGDETSYIPMRNAVKIGSRYSVCVNGKQRVSGRLLTRNLAITPEAGATMALTVRTRLADAAFDAVDPSIGVKNVSLKDVILAAFKRYGMTEADFVFGADVARDLVTGRKSGKGDPAAGLRAKRVKIAAGAEGIDRDLALSALDEQIAQASQIPTSTDLSKITEEEARPHPPETVLSFCERHLSRYSLMMWDGSDGRVVIGRPDDSQRPLYMMTMRRGPAAQTNNILSATKVEDFELVPAELWVYGVGGGRDQSKARVRALMVDPILYGVTPTLSRSVVIMDESLRTPELAQARARREMLRRSLAKDSWTIETDGLSYWSGSQAIPYSNDTIADIQIDVAGAAQGPYLLYQTTMQGNAATGHTTRFVCAGKGIWSL
jgi:prophage tail gpP-like protein